MKELNAIKEAMENVLDTYRQTKSDYDAGRYEGLKEAFELLTGIRNR